MAQLGIGIAGALAGGAIGSQGVQIDRHRGGCRAERDIDPLPAALVPGRARARRPAHRPRLAGPGVVHLEATYPRAQAEIEEVTAPAGSRESGRRECANTRAP